MATTERIKEIIKTEYKATFHDANVLRAFKFNHNLKASLYPGGKVSYYDGELYQLKKEVLDSTEYDYYTRNWVQSDCFDFAYKEGFSHLIERCRKVYVFMLESYAYDLVKGWVKAGDGLEWVIERPFDYINSIVKEFYTFASKVYALEELLKEAENIKPVFDQALILEFHEAFNGKIWNCSPATLCKVLDFNSPSKVNFKPITGKASLFYFFLHRLHEYYNISAIPKGKFFKSYLERLDLRESSFKDNARLDPFIDDAEKEAIRKRILELMPLKEK
jgi:hypothetical protein